MKKRFPTLLSLWILIAVAEGVFLCKSKQKVNPDANSRKEYSAIDTSIDILSNEFPKARSSAEYNSEAYMRKESPNNKMLRSMLMQDSETYNDVYGAETRRNDYSVVEGSLRGDFMQNEALRNSRNMGPSRPDRRKQELKMHDYLMSPLSRAEGARNENGWAKRRGSNHYNEYAEYGNDYFN